MQTHLQLVFRDFVLHQAHIILIHGQYLGCIPTSIVNNLDHCIIIIISHKNNMFKGAQHLQVAK